MDSILRTHDRLIGGHVSAAGGWVRAIERAEALGGNALQVFSGSPRVWARAPLAAVPAEEIHSVMEKKGIKSIIVHAIYLTNLASDKPDLLQKSIDALVYDLSFVALVHGGGVVVHLGSHQGRGWLAAREQVAAAIRSILEQTPDKARLLIENSAGQKGKLCSELEDIRWLLDQIDSPRLKWCLDTCHAFAAGYDLGDVNRSSHLDHPDHSVQRRSLVTELTRLNLWADLVCVHVNDSRGPAGSGRDRHANLGDGLIPQQDLKFFLSQDQLKALPLILEVPGIDGNGPDIENIVRLKAMVGVET